MCQSVLYINGRVVPHCSLHRFLPDELAASNASEIRKRDQFDEAITAKIGNSFSFPPKDTATTLNGCPIYGDYEHSFAYYL